MSFLDYKDLGNLSAVDPPWQIHLHCDSCRVQWTGCWDASACPVCGGTDAWEDYQQLVAQV